MKTEKTLNIRFVRQASKILRCIAHEDRLRIVECLGEKSLSVGEIMQALRRGQAPVSKHLAVLKRGGIVKSEVQANYRHYSIAFPGVLKILECMRQCGGKPS